VVKRWTTAQGAALFNAHLAVVARTFHIGRNAGAADLTAGHDRR